MADSANIKFGVVPDEQPDYWRRNQYNQKAQADLDRHFTERAHGKRIEKSMSAYAIPRSQKVALRENRIGGIPQVEGGVNNWDPKYLAAQGKLVGAQPVMRGPNEEVDVGAALQSRMAANAAMPGGPTHGPMPGHGMAMGTGRGFNTPTPRVCTLAEGHTYFQPLQIQGFGATQPLAKTGGRLQGVQGRQFEINETVTAYVVDGLQTIDLSKMEPGRLRPLVKVSAPLLGTFLVPQEAIQEVGGGPGANRTVLTDGRGWTPQQMQQMQMQQQQRQLLTNTPVNRPMPPQQQPQFNRPMSAQEQLAQQSRDLLRRKGLLKG
jgi:hypothetical protein